MIIREIKCYHQLPPNNAKSKFYVAPSIRAHTATTDTFIGVLCMPFKKDCSHITTRELQLQPFTSSACYPTFFPEDYGSWCRCKPTFKNHPKYINDINAYVQLEL